MLYRFYKLSLFLGLACICIDLLAGTVMLLRDGRTTAGMPEVGMTYADLRRFLENQFSLSPGSIKYLALPNGIKIEAGLLEREDQLLDEDHFNILSAFGTSILVI